MPPSQSGRSTRALFVAIVVALIGVLSLDATKIAASPTTNAVPSQLIGDTPLRLMQWSNVTWLVFPKSAHGPDGPKTLSDSSQAARVDSRGRLHLAVTKVHGRWRGVQLESLAPLNYGTYRFVTTSRLGTLAKPLVLGLFTYKPSAVPYTNEIDLEDSQSLIGLGYPRDAQYVVQPYKKPQNIHRYSILRRYKTVTQQFTWRPHRVSFETFAGTGPHARLLNHFRYVGPDVPQTDNEHLYINLHLHHPYPPRAGIRSVVLNSYTYTGLKQ